MHRFIYFQRWCHSKCAAADESFYRIRNGDGAIKRGQGPQQKRAFDAKRDGELTDPFGVSSVILG